MKHRTSRPKPAPPDDSPFSSLASALNARLRTAAPSTFAGIVRGPDGVAEVYATVSGPTLAAILVEVHASTGRRVPIRVVAGMQNSLASLESVFDRVRARAQELHDQGVSLVEFGVDVPANRVRLGVEALTPEIAESLRREFGIEQVYVFDAGRYRPT